jgi:DNA invertase Pin-like site-specific DNA recombinase
MGRTIGYARVSTPDQDVTLQLDALRQAGCAEEQMFLDVASGASTTRPGLDACVQALAPGDTLVVWRLDRLGRSMLHLAFQEQRANRVIILFPSVGNEANRVESA